jgi:serine/threonine-protein kinase
MTLGAASLFDLAPGRLFADRWRIVGPRRNAGFSSAIEVVDQMSGERRELQLFPPTLFDTKEQAVELMERLGAWTKLSCDAVLRVFEILPVEPRTLAMVTDVPEGGTLRERLDALGVLHQGDLVRLGLGVLDGLMAIHALGLIHGDVKPSTIFVRGAPGDPRPLLVDGGVTGGLWTAKDLGNKTALIGTPYYAPIEQFGGESPDVRSDVYNLATVLFECATGVLPWPGTSFLEVFQAKLDKRPPSMKRRAPKVEVDERLEQAIVIGLLADKSERYGSAAEFRAALASFA